jgi:hypothetical protein
MKNLKRPIHKRIWSIFLLIIGLEQRKKPEKIKRVIHFKFRVIASKSLIFIKESQTTEPLYNSKKYGMSKDYSLFPNDPFFDGLVKATSMDIKTNQETIYVEKENIVHSNKVDFIKEKMQKAGWILLRNRK